MKVVLDTNVLASEAILDEYLKTIKRISQKLDRAGLHRAWALALPSRVKLVAIRKSFRLCRDPKDDMFIDCAIAGKARIIVSGDQDLLVLKQIMNVRITDAQQFLRELPYKS